MLNIAKIPQMATNPTFLKNPLIFQLTNIYNAKHTL